MVIPDAPEQAPLNAEQAPLDPPLAAGNSLHGLLERVRRVARLATRWLRIRGGSLLLGTAVFVCIAAVLVDRLWKTPPEAVRWAMTVMVVVAIGLAAWRWIWPLRSLQASLTETARRIEYRFPQLGDRLSSVVSLEVDEPHLATPGLVAVAAEQTAQQSRALDFSDALDARPLRWAIAYLLLAVLLVAAAVVVIPATTSLGLQRLAMPWRDLPWPRQYHLQLSIADRVPQGQPVLARVQSYSSESDTSPADSPPASSLPPDVRLEWRAATAPRSIHSIEVDPSSGHAQLNAQRTEQTFEVRATGGDDDTMPWRRVEVNPAPLLTQATFHVTPPTSSGAPPFEESSGPEQMGGRFSVPENSRLQLTAHSDRPIQAASLVLVGQDKQIPLTVDAAGTTLQAEWVLGSESESQMETAKGTIDLAIEWQDADGLSGMYDPRWRIEVIQDTLPVVHWTTPSEDMQVTKNAVLELEFSAHDNYGLQATALQWGPGSIEATNAAADATSWPLYLASDYNSLRRQILLPVAEIPADQAATALLVTAVAIDSSGQVGRSQPLRVYLVSEQELQTQLARDSQRVLEQVREAASRQQIAAERTREASLQSDPQRVQDSLRIASAAQQQAVEQIDQGSTAALPTAQRILERARNSQLKSPFLDSLQQAAEQLEQVRKENLQPAVEQLATAVSNRADVDIDESLAKTADLQSQAASGLQQIGENLAAGLKSQMVAESIRDTAAAQQRLAAASERAADGADRDLTKALADQQREIARQSERLLDQLIDMAEAAEPADRQRLQEAVESLSKGQIAQRMRDAANDLDKQQAGVAADAQQTIAGDMRSIAAEFSSAVSDTSAGAQGQLADQAMQAARQQREVVQQIEQTLSRAGVGSEAAIGQQQDTMQAVAGLRPQLESMPLFPETLDQAQQHMESAMARLKRNPTDSQSVSDAQAAAGLLEEMADSIAQTAQLENQNAAQNGDPPKDASAEEGGSAENAQPGLPVASLFLMRSVQQRLRSEAIRLRDQAAVLEEASSGEQTPSEVAALQQQRQQLADQQRGLADRLNSLLKTASDRAAADDPEGEQNE